MDTSKLSTLHKTRKSHPFLVVCLSMVAVGIAAELIFVTSGRFSVEGSTILRLIPFGIMLYGLLEHYYPEFCRKYRRLTPVFLLAYSAIMLVIQSTPVTIALAAVFGVIIGLFICASLVSFLESGAIQNLGVKAGISASLYSVAVHPFNMAYRHFVQFFSKVSILSVGFIILIALLLVVFYLWPESDKERKPSSRIEAGALTSHELGFLFAGLIILVAMGQVMNSGTLEGQAVIKSMPLLYLAIIFLRVPFAALLGHWIDKRLNILNIAISIALIALGCLVALFINGASAGDAMAYLLLNFGQKGCAFLICILCMTVAANRLNKGFFAGFGLLVYFASEGYLNLPALGISLASFDDRIEFLLTLTIMVIAIFVLMFLIYLSNRVQKTQLAAGEEEQGSLEDVMAKYGLTPREGETLKYVIQGKTTRQISEIMNIEENSVQNNINAIMSKTHTRPRSTLAVKFRNIKC